MNRYAFTPFLICSLLALAVAACGDDGNGGMPDAQVPVQPDAMAPPIDAAPPGPAIVVSADTLTVNEGGEGATITVKLSAAPGAAVTIDLASGDSDAAAVAPASVSFDASSFATEQTITVTAPDDDDDDNETVTITLSGQGLAAVTVEVTVVDDDGLNILVDPTTVAVDEGETATFDVSLTVAPSADVTVTIASGDEGAATVDAATLTFTPDNFDEPQTVTVTGVSDDDDTNETVTVTLSADDVADVTVAVTVTDNTRPFAVDMLVRFTPQSSPDIELVYQGNNIYRGAGTLGVADMMTIENFKIADAAFSATTSFSASATGPQTITLGAPTPLVLTDNANHQTLLIVMAAGDYQFELDATSTTSPVLTVTLAP